MRAGTFFSSAENAAIRARMRAAAERLTLPLKLGLRRSSGNVSGSGTGSSIDFQDHRPYVPGDDPRHIDWQAYARSGHYTMKLYREEVRPLADLVLDVSPSMFLDEAKARRTMELAWFCLESCLRSGSAVRLFSLQGSTVRVHDPLSGWENPAETPAFPPPATPAVPPPFTPPDLTAIPWRAGSLRLFLSDLLFPALPSALIPLLLSGRGRAIILAPNCLAESQPDWLGHTELLDCEGNTRRDLRFTPEDLKNYNSVYQNHFQLWQQESHRHGLPFARIPAEPNFNDALALEALPTGAVELL